MNGNRNVLMSQHIVFYAVQSVAGLTFNMSTVTNLSDSRATLTPPPYGIEQIHIGLAKLSDKHGTVLKVPLNPNQPFGQPVICRPR